MSATWIVTANAGRARIFSQEKANAALEEVTSMVNSAVRLRAQDTESDQIGQLAASKSPHNTGAATQPSGYEPHQTPDEHQTELFARSVAEFLLQGRQQNRFGQLSLIASPEFLGLLRKLIDPQLASVVNLELNKDYTQLNGRDLLEQIAAKQAKE